LLAHQTPLSRRGFSPKSVSGISRPLHSKLIGDRQCRFKNRSKPLTGRHHDDSLVLSKGSKGEWTPHDLRRTGATMMQELGVTLEIIDRCQNHLLGGSKVRRHYLHHDYAKEKTRAWDLLGSRLETILGSVRKVMA
ncbi:hypothetical protein LER27_13850, partial [Pseudomonas aeruginosa]